jgi:hypothetical protein
MISKDESLDYERLNIRLHTSVMGMYKRLAAKRHTSVTETVRRAGMVLDEVEKVDETPNTVLGICTLDPKTGEVVQVQHLKLIG